MEGIASLHRYKVNVDNMVCNIHMEGMAYMHRCKVRVEPQQGDVHDIYLILVLYHWYVGCVGMHILYILNLCRLCAHHLFESFTLHLRICITEDTQDLHTRVYASNNL